MDKNIRNHPNLNRLSSGVVANKNTDEIQNYKAQRREKKRINNLEEMVSDMQEDLAEIKAMLKNKIA